MICEVVAIGSELLLGPSVDTNSTWIGERLAENGINSYFHTVVGDNFARMVEALRVALSRSDAVIVTGGLGPTADDITREAIAEVMGVELENDEILVSNLHRIFAERNREMSPSNLRQALRPVGSVPIMQTRGTAPGLMCPVEDKVIYAMPGVPFEMKEMMERAVLPDLRKRSGDPSTIVSRFLRTWGAPESVLGEMVAPRVAALEAGGNTTVAFLAKGIEGIFIRITARAGSRPAAVALLDAEEVLLRELIGPLVFGIDNETMEFAVGELLRQQGLTLGLAESMTGGLVASRITSVPGASEWFRGSVVSYASEVKFDVLGVAEGPVVSESAAIQMAEGSRRVLGSDIGVGITGVAGPSEQDGLPVGTVFAAFAMPGRTTQSVQLHLSGDRQRIREFACINVLNELRKLLSNPSS